MNALSASIRVERIGNATLYLGDAEAVTNRLRSIGSFTADWLVCTDPPYGIGINAANAKRSRGFRPHDSKARARDFSNVVGDDRPFNPEHLLWWRHLVLWGANNFADKLPASPCWFSWDRKAGKAAASDITDCELAWTQGLPFKTVRMFRHMWAGFQRDSEVGERHLHPTQKPVALFDWCLSFFPSVSTVVDPYMGSGPCGVAAVKAGKQYYGAEIDPEHFETACMRIEAAYRQPDMFAAAQPKEDPSFLRQGALFEPPVKL